MLRGREFVCARGTADLSDAELVVPRDLFLLTPGLGIISSSRETALNSFRYLSRSRISLNGLERDVVNISLASVKSRLKSSH